MIIFPFPLAGHALLLLQLRQILLTSELSGWNALHTRRAWTGMILILTLMTRLSSESRTTRVNTLRAAAQPAAVVALK